MVFFHPHEGCFQVCFGIAVAVFPHDLKTFLIFHQAGPAFFQFLAELLDFWFMFPLPVNKSDPLSLRNPHQVPLQLQELQWGTVVNLKNSVIGDFLMFCQLSFPVFFNNLPDFVHSFDHKHPGIPEVVFGTVPVLEQKRIIL